VTASFLKITKMLFSVLLLSLFIDYGFPSAEILFGEPAPIFGGKTSHEGTLAALMDVNGDRSSDLILISSDKSKLLILKSKSMQVKTNELDDFETIDLGKVGAKSVVPADFNGDKVMDLLIVYPDGKNNELINVEILWGKNNYAWNKNYVFKSNVSMMDEPLLVEANSDGISDLFVVLSNGKREFWLGKSVENLEDFTFDIHNFKSVDTGLRSLYIPHSHAIVTFNGAPDSKLMLTAKSGLHNQLIVEEWESRGTGLYKIKDIKLPIDYNSNENYVTGQTSYCDFNGDGNIDLIIPICILKDKQCTQSKIIVYINSVWSTAYIGNSDWNFIYGQEKNEISESIRLVCGDFNHDGFVDVVTIMGNKKGNAVVLQGGICEDTWCKDSQRSLKLGMQVKTKDSTLLATLADVNDDGALDILTTDVVGTSSDFKIVTRAYLNRINIDDCFINVVVLSSSASSSKTKKFYLPTPGSTVICDTTDPQGNNVISTVAQLTQSSHNSLLPPNVDFGLGLLPNFVDSLIVRLPVPLLPEQSLKNNKKHQNIGNKTYKVYEQKFTMLIPNSRVLITAEPNYSPANWKIQIIVTPSRYFMLTLLVFVGVCFVVSCAIAILHCLEMRRDKREKILQKHNFHFDAM